MNKESTENKIISILSDYISEKGLDFVSSKIGDLLERKKIKDNIAAEIEKAQSGFEKACRNEEFDFQGLIELVKGFDDKDFIIKYTIAFSEPDKLEKAKEQILHICIRDTHANTPDAQSKVKSILDNCFSIVEETLKFELSKGDLIEIGLINKSIDENTNKIIENSNQNTKSILNAINVQKASSAQPGKKEITNDNESYLNNFSNLLFLEDDYEDENVVSLADMYISPSIKGKDIKASECVKKWYNTKTKPCLLLYGNAGVGKSSFVSKILADANGKAEKSKVEFDFDSSKVMAVALRNHTDNINIQLTAEEILTRLFNCDFAEQLKDKLLILDGLDELCVLKHGFEGEIFLEKLSRLGYGYHVLITSRESKSYFTEPCNEEGLKTERLVWEEKQIKDWLNLYKAQKPRKEKWCIKFHEQFYSLETDDIRREIFCVPIILYICGTSETNIEDHSSIGSIYRDAFTKILLRKHLKGQSNTDEIKEADKETNITAWQFTKELAYQMFLVDSLDLVDDDTSTDRRAVGFRNATKRTKDILKEEYKIEKPDLELKKELAICPFARENEKGGITFAHKTVYEYFTAVKLYEDYFAKFDDKYFNDNDNDTAAMDVTQSFFEAFRYDGIPDDIFSYLCKMNEEPFANKLGYSESQGLDYKKYEQKFVYAMQNHMYVMIGMKPAVEEYIYLPDYKMYRVSNYTDWKFKTVDKQANTSLANFTCFLTGHGFKNEEKVLECMLIGNLLHSPSRHACFKGWHLEGAYLAGADLSGADLSSADLTGADLRGINLQYANLKCSNLTSANLYCANMTYADLSGVYLERTHLEESINLEYAKYCNDPRAKTIFPEGFEPKEHNMKEVNVLGELVENE